jgi:leucyl/phenylalanyl-tRNA--protein transferase
MNFIPKLEKDSIVFPDPAKMLENGIVAWGGDLCAERLIEAYKNGIFPWYGEKDPILWWFPSKRMILYPEDFKISRSLKKSIKKYEIKIDTNFEKVIFECRNIKRKKQNGSWILEETIEAYTNLHRLGYAHSFETYCNNELVGGLYGICIGRVFCGESMFYKLKDASKVALWKLTEFCKIYSINFIDCQIPSSHLKRMGAKEIKGDKFLELLRKNLKKNRLPKNWRNLCI